MSAITAGRTSFSDFENDVKILFSEWRIKQSLKLELHNEVN